MNGRLIVAGLVIAAAAGGAGLALYQARTAGERIADAAPQALTTVPDFTFSDPEGHPHQSNEWMGKVLVLNFWATWCPPCLQEVPTFVRYQKSYGDKGLQFVGIAVDELDAVRDFRRAHGVNYPLLLGETDAVQLSQRLGDRLSGLPFTVVFDRNGQVRFRQLGELTAEMLDTHVVPLLGLPSPPGS